MEVAMLVNCLISLMKGVCGGHCNLAATVILELRLQFAIKIAQLGLEWNAV